MELFDTSEVHWARWPWQKCYARLETGIRCELVKEHEGYHIGLRGAVEIAWTTKTFYPSLGPTIGPKRL